MPVAFGEPCVVPSADTSAQDRSPAPDGHPAIDEAEPSGESAEARTVARTVAGGPTRPVSARERRVPRFHAPLLPAAGTTLPLAADAAQHARVLRVAAGDTLALFDGTGVEAWATVMGTEPYTVEVGEARTYAAGPELVLIQAIPKGSKLDLIVRMATEIGATTIVCVETARTLGGLSASKRERLQRIAAEAARQSGRSAVPRIEGPCSLAESVAFIAPDTQRFVFWEGALTPFAPHGQLEGQGVACVVGAEGGLSATEVAGLEAQGFAPVGLPLPILRVETAAPVALGLVAFHQTAHEVV